MASRSFAFTQPFGSLPATLTIEANVADVRGQYRAAFDARHGGRARAGAAWLDVQLADLSSIARAGCLMRIKLACDVVTCLM